MRAILSDNSSKARSKNVLGKNESENKDACEDGRAFQRAGAWKLKDLSEISSL